MKGNSPPTQYHSRFWLRNQPLSPNWAEYWKADVNGCIQRHVEREALYTLSPLLGQCLGTKLADQRCCP